MKRFVTRIYSLNNSYPLCEKITVLFIEILDSKISTRFIGKTKSDISVTLKHKFCHAINQTYDLDYFNHADNYSAKKDYNIGKTNVRLRGYGV